MKITNKDVCMFAGGAVIGAAVCGITVVYKFISSETFGPAIIKAAADRCCDSLIGSSNKRNEYVPYRRSDYVSPCRRPSKVSYVSYYDRYNPRED